ncbi:MAG: hypothetical protein KatS3mg089_0379 [Patescibacteria group bacterium]|nr:MAG: hypothetical protein KatS3mg089_0379 [Patescibacteria group bacterium]
MNKKQKDHPHYSHLIIYIFIIFTLVCSSLIFVPAISTLTLPFAREKLRKEFLTDIKDTNYLNTQKFWKFRDFYSPGSGIFSKTGIPSDLVANTLAIIDIPISLSPTDKAFLIYKSPKLVSIDFLVAEHELSKIIKSEELHSKTVIYRDNDTVLYRENNLYKLIFLKSQKELKKTVGFFDFNGLDRGITENKYWLNLTRFEN